MSMDRDIEFLYEIGSMRFMPRQWKRFLNADFANLAEHHLRVIWIALIIAKHEKADIDQVIKMALVHDIAESRTGDVDYLSRQYVDRNEELGLKDMVNKTAAEKDLRELYEAYEKRESLEAKIVKDADNLDVDMELAEQEVRGFKGRYAWTKQRSYVGENRLYTKTAKLMWRKIQKNDPNAWHINGRNRINSGDWKSLKP
jgi:putative hydrolase of HD superfamily